ncbi:hypothetical protein FKG94_02785 [Exilibacterium tricleocarpae]|uniref:Spore coat protein U domain-containing protein n=1 Tax=Exilibacterium tricleocarpae TaxID=2591008 RepID=A0A545U6N4_9GAMM|nr:hypothetical protein [Exilibacterium tricleocarpae]TQV85132.1 hypothetical protein FKG94_02785 [Exilibacterium tricleocarpae]
MLAGLLLCFLASTGGAAIQGETGLTSVGQIVIRLNLEPFYQISRLDDIVLRVTDFESPIRHREGLCIRGPRNSTYTITTDSEAGSSFTVGDGAGNSIPYQVFFYEDIQQTNADQLQVEQRSRPYAIRDSGVDCDGRDNSAIEIFIDAEDLRNAEYGIYNGVLVLTVGSV